MIKAWKLVLCQSNSTLFLSQGKCDRTIEELACSHPMRGRYKVYSVSSVMDLAKKMFNSSPGFRTLSLYEMLQKKEKNQRVSRGSTRGV